MVLSGQYEALADEYFSSFKDGGTRADPQDRGPMYRVGDQGH